ncbi:HCO3 transporter family protein [Geopyxis carbonaria]|nr:HCO3 transporter family protein [Geopyxis carbonaria]
MSNTPSQHFSEKDPEDPGISQAPPQKDPYSFDNVSGWRSIRILRPGRGMYHDVRRRAPYYRSDITDAWTYRTFASTVRMYFVNLLPALAYTLDMYRRTGFFYGVNEALLASVLAAVVFSLFSAQPLTIVGVTGLISLFNYTIYDIVAARTDYAQFMCWVAIWAAALHIVVALANWCDYMRYVTDFSSEAFGMYVGIIYMIKGVEELVDEFTRGSEDGYMSCLVALLFFGTVYALEAVGGSVFFRPWVRSFLADYAYAFGTIFWVGFCHIPGNLAAVNITALPISRAFHPSTDRDWLIPFWRLPVGWVFAALPFGLLITLLFYYDHNVSSLTAQAKQYPLRKPGGFHWDFFLLGLTTLVSGLLGLPLPNGLVPQAPVHTDSLCERQTHTDAHRRPVITISRVVEQRVTHLLMGLLLLGTMTGPLLTVLGLMPRALFAGVFFVVGWGSIETNGMTKKLLHLLAEPRFASDASPLAAVPRKQVWAYLVWQAAGVAVCVAVSQTVAAVGFPLLICALIPLRWKVMPRWFEVSELEKMDALTADSEVVLASLGGRPAGMGGQGGEDGGAVRQRVGAIHR